MQRRTIMAFALIISLILPAYSAESGNAPLYAENGIEPRVYTAEEQREAAVDLANMGDEDTAMAYLFLTSYDLMMEGKGQGGLLCFSDQGEYIAGFRMDGTPEDFFTALPPSTLLVPYAVPTEAAAAFFAGLGDVESVSRLAEYRDKGGLSCALVTALKIYGEVTSEDPVYSLARQRIEGSAAASGLDIGPFYEAYASRGITEADLVNRLIHGEKTPNEIALEAIRIMKENSAGTPMLSKAMPVFGIAGIVLGIIVISVAIAGMIISRRPLKTDEMDAREEGDDSTEKAEMEDSGEK